MPRTPPERIAASHGTAGLHPRPHLTLRELAARWNVTVRTARRNYAAWGLRPMRFGGAGMLFSIEQIEAAEERAMRGEFAPRAPIPRSQAPDEAF